MVVNGWSDSIFMRIFRIPIQIMEKLFHVGEVRKDVLKPEISAPQKPAGTFVNKLTLPALGNYLGDGFPN